MGAPHKARCAACRARVRVVMDTKLNAWVYAQHINHRVGDWCAQSGRRVP